MRCLLLILCFAVALIAACSRSESAQTDQAANRFTPIPLENAVLLQVDSSRSLANVIDSLPNYQNAFFNTVVIRLPGSFDSKTFSALVDSCHALGMNCVLRETDPRNVRLRLLTAYDIDGFVCDHAARIPLAAWQKKIDSLQLVKAVLMVASGIYPGIKDVGFGGGFDATMAAALDSATQLGASTQTVYAALRRNDTLFSNYFLPVRVVNERPNTAGESVALMTALVSKGVPYLTERQWTEHRAALLPVLQKHNDAPVLQYGSFEPFDGQSKDVFTFMREYEEKKTMFAFNFHDRPAPYVWPLYMLGVGHALMLGDAVSREGGQDVSARGCQIIAFTKPIRISHE